MMHCSGWPCFCQLHLGKRVLVSWTVRGGLQTVVPLLWEMHRILNFPTLCCKLGKWLLESLTLKLLVLYNEVWQGESWETTQYQPTAGKSGSAWRLINTAECTVSLLASLTLVCPAYHVYLRSNQMSFQPFNKMIQTMDESPFIMGCLTSRLISQVFSVNKTHFIVCPFKHLKILAILSKPFNVLTISLGGVICSLCFVFFCLFFLRFPYVY